MLDGLPALLNNIKMMHTIARYYNTPERMTTLFYKARALQVDLRLTQVDPSLTPA